MKSFLSSIFFLICFRATAQLPYEQIYLQTDQPEYYIAGETVWFKAYLYSPFINTHYSTTLYTEILDEELNPVVSGKFLVDGGISIGQLKLPVNLPQGPYLLRAYTAWSLNFGEHNIYKKGLMVFNPITAPAVEKHSGELMCSFYPESGKIIYELQNLIAFRISESEFKKQSYRGAVIDKDGKELFRVSTDSMGRGQFNIQPGKGNEYRLRIQVPGKDQQTYFPFPAMEETGLLLHAEDRDNDKSFRISRLDTSNHDYDRLLLQGVMYNRNVFQMDIDMKGEKELSGALKTDLLPTGILQLLLIDNDNNIISQRNILIDHNDEVPVNAMTDTFSLKRGSMNVIGMDFPDSLSGNFSISVTAIANDTINKWNENIIDGLFLQPGNKELQTGFEQDLTSIEKDLVAVTSYRDAVIPTNEEKFKETPYIRIRGSIGMPLDKIKTIPTEITFIVQTKDSTQTAISTAVSPSGTFELNDLVFSDTAQFFYQFKAAKPLAKQLPVKLEKDSSYQFSSHADYSMYFNNAKKVMTSVALNESFRKKIEKKYHDITIDTAKGIMLEEVVLKKGKKETPLSKVNKEYTTGIFSATGYSYNIDLINNNDAAGAPNIFEYLRGKVPGLVITRTASGGYAIESSRSISTLDMVQGGNGLVDGQVYLNESPITTDQVANIPVDQIAYVKFYPPGKLMALVGSGISCILVIYTKNGTVTTDNRQYLGQFKYPGYTETLDFTPNRTLYWNPDVILNKDKHLKVRFRNTESDYGYRIIMEGITTDGRAIHFEKIFK